MSCSKCGTGPRCPKKTTRLSPSTRVQEQGSGVVSSELGEDAESAANTETCHSRTENAIEDSFPTKARSKPTAIAPREGGHRFDTEEKGKNGQQPGAQKTMVSFSNGDPDNPYNWSVRKKTFILIAGIISVINSTLGSSLPSGAINYISKDFHVTNEQQLVLPISLFLVGYVLGPIFFGPLSETYGRRDIMISSFVVFTLFTMACALAPNWPALLVFRFICGVNASSAIAVVGGLYADVFGDPVIRGRAMAIFMVVSETSDSDRPMAR